MLVPSGAWISGCLLQARLKIDFNGNGRGGAEDGLMIEKLTAKYPLDHWRDWVAARLAINRVVEGRS